MNTAWRAKRDNSICGAVNEYSLTRKARNLYVAYVEPIVKCNIDHQHKSICGAVNEYSLTRKARQVYLRSCKWIQLDAQSKKCLRGLRGVDPEMQRRSPAQVHLRSCKWMRRTPRLTYTTLAVRLTKDSLYCYCMRLKPVLVCGGQLLPSVTNLRAAHHQLGQV